MQMRLRKGWPPYLYHGDLRCGTKYPLPRTIRTNNTEGYYLDIPSQCDVLSNAPCCRDDVGWCGSGKAFCDCKTCTDYRTYLPAELADWQTSDGCVIPSIESQDACAILSKHFTSVTFIGDSLVRHMFSALLILLTNDKKKGALRTDISQRAVELCADENQFVDSACHTKLAMNYADVKSHKTYCANLTNHNKPLLSFVEAYSMKQSSLAIKTISEKLLETRPFILLGIGIHDSFDHSRVIAELLLPIVELRRSVWKDNSTIIWLNTHASGPLKPTEFRERQGNEKIQVFNSMVQKFCEMNNLLVIDTFNFTTGVYSFDGTHYGFEINRLKTQILLNGLTDAINNNNNN